MTHVSRRRWVIDTTAHDRWLELHLVQPSDRLCWCCVGTYLDPHGRALRGRASRAMIDRRQCADGRGAQSRGAGVCIGQICMTSAAFMAVVLPWGPELHSPGSNPDVASEILRAKRRVNRTRDVASGRSWDAIRSDLSALGLVQTSTPAAVRGMCRLENGMNFFWVYWV